MAVLELNESNFNNTIQNEKIVLVDFWASWCGPCKLIAPVLEEVESELNEDELIAKVNVDENPTLSKQYGIMSIPTLLLFKDGNVTDKMTGLPRGDAKGTIKNFIDKNK